VYSPHSPLAEFTLISNGTGVKLCCPVDGLIPTIALLSTVKIVPSVWTKIGGLLGLM
jgi:hypothetical protein